MLRLMPLVLFLGCTAVLGIDWWTQPTKESFRADLREPAGERIKFTPGRPQLLHFDSGKSQEVLSVLNVHKPLHYGEFVWNEAGIASGKVWARVDLNRQIISIFRGGHEIGTAVILYGSDDTPTPTGEFPIIEKRVDYHSRTYDAPMPYMMRLTNDGVALHASDVRRRAVTHGCIGLPLEFARLLFEQLQVGDPVFVEGESIA